jgi:RNA polymerase sigma-70 factor (ECF subfamily)
VTVDDRELLARQFEQHRPHLVRVAYRMLGSMSEAEDAVQQAWLRLDRSNADGVANLGGWLTTVVARVCLDALRTRKARREEFEGTWLPEPVVEIDDGPEERALLADAIGLALLVVLETLTPPERLAFVLHDMFSVSFDEIAAILERSPAAARQLASRARRRVRGAAPVPDSDLARQRRLVDAFLSASRGGDFEALVAVLHPDVVLRVDRGKGLAQLPLEGAERVARAVLERGSPFAALARPALVNGAAGVVVGRDGRLYSVVAFTVTDGRISTIDVVADPAKLSTVAASYGR